MVGAFVCTVLSDASIQVLCMVVSWELSSVSKLQFVGRYGGGTFILVPDLSEVSGSTFSAAICFAICVFAGGSSIQLKSGCA